MDLLSRKKSGKMDKNEKIFWDRGRTYAFTKEDVDKAYKKGWRDGLDHAAAVAWREMVDAEAIYCAEDVSYNLACTHIASAILAEKE